MWTIGLSCNLRSCHGWLLVCRWARRLLGRLRWRLLWRPPLRLSLKLLRALSLRLPSCSDREGRRTRRVLPLWRRLSPLLPVDALRRSPLPGDGPAVRCRFRKAGRSLVQSLNRAGG